MCLFADNHEKFADLVDTERPEVQAAMTALLTLSKKANELRLMSLYEQRLNRTLLTTMKQLNERQAERKQRQEKEMEEPSQRWLRFFAQEIRDLSEPRAAQGGGRNRLPGPLQPEKVPSRARQPAVS